MEILASGFSLVKPGCKGHLGSEPVDWNSVALSLSQTNGQNKQTKKRTEKGQSGVLRVSSCRAILTFFL